MHEASLHEENCFITLTYAPENLPENGTLVKRDLQLFFKRLRKQTKKEGIKYYAVGEYGKELQRPHYHICVFGYDFDDKVLWKANSIPNRALYRSKLLETLWTDGYSSVGSLTPDSAGYVARYCNKKITGANATVHYDGKLPEFALMSRGGRSGHGIAWEWFQKYSTDVYPKDFVTLKGRKERPPRYYDNLEEQNDSDILLSVKAKRRQYAQEHPESGRRLLEREKYKRLVTKTLVRHFETGETDIQEARK